MDNLKDDKYYIIKILADIDFLIEHTKGMTEKDIKSNDLLVDSIMFRIVQIAENNSKLSEAFKNAHSSVAWDDIRGLRNRIVHAYGDVDLDVVCEAVFEDLPILHNQLLDIEK